ncbi:transposase, partial [Escherichia coli]
MWVTAKECVGLPDLPMMEHNIRHRLTKAAAGNAAMLRKRKGTKAIEFNIDCLPSGAQQVLRERYVLQLMTQKADESPAPVVTKARRSSDVVDAVEAYRGSPQLMVERLNALTENQRQVADARIAIVSEVMKVAQQPGFSCAKAIRFIVDNLARSQLDERIVAMVETANAKKGNSRALSEITLKRWIAAFNKAQNAAERLLLLAPGKRQEIKAEDINWLPEFLAQYRQSNGRPMTEAYEDFVAEWRLRHADEPYMLDIMPSYDTIRRAMKKLPEVVKQKGRVTGSEYRQLEGFTRRDWSRMPVNYVWIGDGHGMKMKCRHPVHGRPFAPEVTFVIDGGTRFVVGWSMDLAENVFAVAGAIQHGIRHHGKPFLYYSDNGSGETADVLDKEVVGILPRLGINHPTGIAGNPQGRGIIERLNRTLPMRIARKYRTYFGKGA